MTAAIDMSDPGAIQNWLEQNAGFHEALPESEHRAVALGAWRQASTGAAQFCAFGGERWALKQPVEFRRVHGMVYAARCLSATGET